IVFKHLNPNFSAGTAEKAEHRGTRGLSHPTLSGANSAVLPQISSKVTEGGIKFRSSLTTLQNGGSTLFLGLAAV
ncbi:uncharacterized protein METZ01_LOCUS469400, partial [marine metagenome]